MKPSERAAQLLATCVEAAMETERQKVTTNSYAPSKQEFEEQMRRPRNAGIHQAILTRAYAASLLMVMDEERKRFDEQISALWQDIRRVNGGPLKGDP